MISSPVTVEVPAGVIPGAGWTPVGTTPLWPVRLAAGTLPVGLAALPVVLDVPTTLPVASVVTCAGGVTPGVFMALAALVATTAAAAPPAAAATTLAAVFGLLVNVPSLALATTGAPGSAGLSVSSPATIAVVGSVPLPVAILPVTDASCDELIGGTTDLSPAAVTGFAPGLGTTLVSPLAPSRGLAAPPTPLPASTVVLTEPSALRLEPGAPGVPLPAIFRPGTTDEATALPASSPVPVTSTSSPAAFKAAPAAAPAAGLRPQPSAH